jgi:Short C-terminal domain
MRGARRLLGSRGRMGFFSRKKEQPPEAGDAVVSGEVPPEAQEVVDKLEHMFPGAHIAVDSKTITDPAQVQAVLQAALGGGGGGPTDRESARVAALERLAELHKHGALTDEEFEWEKKKILDAS